MEHWFTPPFQLNVVERRWFPATLPVYRTRWCGLLLPTVVVLPEHTYQPHHPPTYFATTTLPDLTLPLQTFTYSAIPPTALDTVSADVNGGGALPTPAGVTATRWCRCIFHPAHTTVVVYGDFATNWLAVSPPHMPTVQRHTCCPTTTPCGTNGHGVADVRRIPPLVHTQQWALIADVQTTAPHHLGGRVDGIFLDGSDLTTHWVHRLVTWPHYPFLQFI